MVEDIRRLVKEVRRLSRGLSLDLKEVLKGDLQKLKDKFTQDKLIRTVSSPTIIQKKNDSKELQPPQPAAKPRGKIELKV